jgi:hypothetical protein
MLVTFLTAGDAVRLVIGILLKKKLRILAKKEGV